MNPFRSIDEALQSQVSTREVNLYKQVVERYNRKNLPYINEEGIVEFP